MDRMVSAFSLPKRVLSSTGHTDLPCAEFFPKLNPHDGTEICQVARTPASALAPLLKQARYAQAAWAALPAVRRGEILFDIAGAMKSRREEIVRVVALETGKSLKDASGETGAAIQQAMFMAGEGQRYFGRTATSASPNRHPMVLREPVGLAGLIMAANTPIANVAWKVFPALICGNAALLKASEDTPLTAWLFGKIAAEAGLPEGVLTILHGLGKEIGAAIVESDEVALISFTGSTAVGKYIARTAGERLAKICLELGGKNPLVVCDDADLDSAVDWAALSAFSNAGQRCASASRIVIFSAVYESFRGKFLKKVNALKVGHGEGDDLGPVINERQLRNMLASVEGAKARGAKVLAGGNRLESAAHRNGFYMAPTVLENVAPGDEMSYTELFGPITALYKADDFAHALELSNNSPYGLTASIHTRNWNRAQEFMRKVEAGVAVVNGGTHGGEAHMPFGGVKSSGNGWREPGPEAIDVYSNIKVVYQMVNPADV